MCLLYITEHNRKIHLQSGRFIITDKNNVLLKSIPRQTVTGISIFGNSQLSSHCIHYCLNNNVPVSFFSHSGRCYGHLSNLCNQNTSRIRKQFSLTLDKSFVLTMAKKFITAKIHNQSVVATRYLKSDHINSPLSSLLQIYTTKAKTAANIASLRGFEGMAAREYFSVLSSLLPKEFQFDNRTRRPPEDPFNTMLSLGYSLLCKEIAGEVENRGLLSQAGFLHDEYRTRPSLACDMIEEWRPVIVDSLVMSLIRKHEIAITDFSYRDGSCSLSPDGLKLFLSKFETRLLTESKYISSVNRPITFRQAIWHQANNMMKLIEENDVSLYQPVFIR